MERRAMALAPAEAIEDTAFFELTFSAALYNVRSHLDFDGPFSPVDDSLAVRSAPLPHLRLYYGRALGNGPRATPGGRAHRRRDRRTLASARARPGPGARAIHD